jgi:hypothetical protein
MALMRTSSAKAKGRLLQKLVVSKMLETFPQLEADDCKSTSMGNSGEDIQLSPAARKVMPISVECKNRASMAVYKDYAQATSNAKSNEPVLVIKQDRSKPLVVIDLDYFMRLLKGKTNAI